MDLTDSQTSVTLIAGLAIVVGLFGIVIPLLPGLLLSWAGVLFWAIFGEGGWGKWVVFGVASLIVLAGIVVKYALPGRNLKRAGVPNRSLLLGGLLGLVGFFVIPVVGLPIGFVLGIYLAEHARLRESGPAWEATKHALKAAGLAMLIELTSGLCLLATWVIGLLVV